MSRYTKPRGRGELGRFTGQYAKDGKARRLAVREAAGHRCIRCGHPFQSGKHGKGEWSPCDKECTHGGPARYFDAADGWRDWLLSGSTGARVCAGRIIQAQWRILTVHHFDGNKANDAWWNCMSLCQRCHLTIQSRVDPHIPYFFEHSEWAKPYIAGFYAHKYEGREITREEAMERLDELLRYEFKGA